MEILTEQDLNTELVNFWAENKEIIMENLNFEFPTDSVAKDRKSKFSLLLHDLPEKGEKSFFKSAQDFSNVRNDGLTVIVGTSGAGKTRSIFEYLCSHYGFYLLAENDEYVNYGSKELTLFFSKTVLKLDRNNQAENSEFVERYMNCALASRIYLFLELAKEVGFTPKKWLLVQILLDSSNDYFLKLTDIFRKASETVLGQLWKRFRASKLFEGNMPVFIDEAQTLLFKLENFFPGTNGSRPLYTAVVKSVMKGQVGEIANSSIFSLVVSGTGLRLQSAGELCSSSLKKGNYTTIKIQEYFDEESVKEFFLSRYGREIDDGIAYWLSGRPRIVCNFIETLLAEGKEVDIQFELEQYKAERTSNKPGTYYQAYHALADRVKDEKMKLELYCSVKRAVCDFMITGRPVKHCSNNFIKTFEAGFSRLSTVDGKMGVMMDEPIPLLAGFKYFSDNDPFKQKAGLLTSLAYEAGPLGVAWERYLLDNLRKYFGKDVESKFNLSEEFIGCQSRIFCPNKGDEFRAKKSGDDYTLANFLEDPTSQFFFPESDAGPDIVFFVELQLANSAQVLRIPVFVQAKFAVKLKYAELEKAILTTDPLHFYEDINGKVQERYLERKAKIQKFCNNRTHLALVICYPFAIRYGVQNETRKDRYLKIIDGTCPQQLFTEEETEFFNMLKNDRNIGTDYSDMPIAKRLRSRD